MLFNKIRYSILLRAVSVLLINAFLVSNIASAIQNPLTCALSTTSSFNPIAKIIKTTDGFVIISNEERLKELVQGFKRDAEIRYFNFLKDQAIKIGLSQVGLKLLIKKHISSLDKKFNETKTSPVKEFNAWDGVMVINDKRVSFFKTNSSKFFPENPSDFMEGLRNFMKTGNFFPIRVDIDITNFCNDNCIMCFNPDRDATYIPRDRVIRILDNLANMGAKSIRFTGGGEPLTHRHFAEFVKHAHEKGFKITVETNGDLLNDETVELLVKYADHVRVSVNSSRNDTRAAVHRPKDSQRTIDTLMHGLERLVEKRKEIGREDELLLGATFLILPENYREVGAFISRMKKIGIDWVAVRKTTDRTAYAENPKLLEVALRQLEAAKEKEGGPTFKVEGPYGVSYIPQQDFQKCLIAATRFTILANSTQPLCCLARNGINLDRVLLGKIGDGVNPITTLLEKEKAKVAEFMETAPTFCDFCIDSDFNFFFGFALNILESAPESKVRRVQLVPSNGDKLLIGESDTEDGIVPVSLPDEYYEKFSRGEIVNIDLSEATDTIQDKIEWGQRFIDTTLWRAQKAKDKNEAIAVGLGTGYIPKEHLPYIQGLLSELSRTARKRGLDNIVIRQAKKDLASEIRRGIRELKAKGFNVPNSNIVILDEYSSLESRAFDQFRQGANPEEWAFFGEIELPDGFSGNNYLRLLAMLTTSINLAFGDTIASSIPSVQVVQQGKRIFRFILQPEEPYDPELLREIYEGQVRQMRSA